MKTINIKSRIGSDGILKVKVPTGEKEVDVEVLIILQTDMKKNNSWPKNFIDATYGCLKNNPLKRLPQGDFQNRRVFQDKKFKN